LRSSLPRKRCLASTKSREYGTVSRLGTAAAGLPVLGSSHCVVRVYGFSGA
jgi:hypothetical protein